ncbi:MAG TPA: hypothetical protein VFW96_12685 [Thermomicrobiales bacterium]|nr:hypothetical protein [Thermomicrobiales bacterium]
MSPHDVAYYGLSIVLLLLLAYAARHALGVGRASTGRAPRRGLGQACRRRALGVGLAATGTVLALVVGVAVTEIWWRFDALNADAATARLYQQARFSLWYVAFALILFGIVAAVAPAPRARPSHGADRRWVATRLLLWALFAIAVGVAAAHLFNADTYAITRSGSRFNAVQQRVFYLPLIVATALGAALAAGSALRAADAATRRRLAWLASFAALLLLGLLAEATIIPGIGDLAVLEAFIPFTAAGGCLCLAARSLPTGGPARD